MKKATLVVVFLAFTIVSCGSSEETGTTQSQTTLKTDQSWVSYGKTEFSSFLYDQDNIRNTPEGTKELMVKWIWSDIDVRDDFIRKEIDCSSYRFRVLEQTTNLVDGTVIEKRASGSWVSVESGSNEERLLNNVCAK